MNRIFPGEPDERIINRLKAINNSGLKELLIMHVDDQDVVTSTTEYASGIVNFALTELFGNESFKLLVSVGDDPRVIEEMYREEEEEGTFDKEGVFSVLGLDLMFLNSYGGSGHDGRDMFDLMDKLKGSRKREYEEVKSELESLEFFDDGDFFLGFKDERLHFEYRLKGLEKYLFRYLDGVIPLSTTIDEEAAKRDSTYTGVKNFLCSPCEKNQGRTIGLQLVERGIKLYTGEVQPVNFRSYQGDFKFPNLGI